jgi:hypothetical protein
MLAIQPRSASNTLESLCKSIHGYQTRDHTKLTFLGSMPNPSLDTS